MTLSPPALLLATLTALSSVKPKKDQTIPMRRQKRHPQRRESCWPSLFVHCVIKRCDEMSLKGVTKYSEVKCIESKYYI